MNSNLPNSSGGGSILFLCEYCFEGFDSALRLIQHKKQHYKTTGDPGDGANENSVHVPPDNSNNVNIDVNKTLPANFGSEKSTLNSLHRPPEAVSNSPNTEKCQIVFPKAVSTENDERNRKKESHQNEKLVQLERKRSEQDVPHHDIPQPGDTVFPSRNAQVQSIDPVQNRSTKPDNAISIEKKSFDKEAQVEVSRQLPHRQDQKLPRRKPYKFQCRYCKKANFSFRSHLLSHERTHTGERPFICSHCNKSFTRKAALINHRATDRCKAQLKRNRQEIGKRGSIPIFPIPVLPRDSHNKGKEIQAAVASSSCSYEERDHDQNIDLDLPYNCQYCGECYASSSEFTEHFNMSQTCAMLRDRDKPLHDIPEKEIQPPYLSVANKNQPQDPPLYNYVNSAQVPFQTPVAVNDSRTVGPTSGVNECRFCGKVYSSAIHLANHERIRHTGEKPFQCPQCDRSFSLQRFLSNHVKSHGRNRTGRPRKPIAELSNREIKRKINISYSNETNANESLEQKHSECPPKPEYATEKTIAPTKSESSHITRSYINFKTYYCCNFCDNKYSAEYHAINHVRMHTGDKPFKCASCPAQFATKQLLTFHLRSNHRGRRGRKRTPLAKYTNSYLYSCHICGKRYKYNSLLKIHLKRCAGSSFCDTDPVTPGPGPLLATGEPPNHSQRNVAMASAGTTTLALKALRRIKRKRKINKQPNLALLNFTTPNLTAETGVVRFVCNFCQKSYTNSWYATQHVRIHTGEVSHKCQDCNKGFTLETTLISHRQKYHSGAANKKLPFKCKVCIRYFPTLGKLNSHTARSCSGFNMQKRDTSPSAGLETVGFGIKSGSRENCKPAVVDDESESGMDDGKSPTDDELEFGERIETAVSARDDVQHKPTVNTGNDKNKMESTSAAPVKRLNYQYKCEFCEKSFAYKVALMNHVRIHQGGDHCPYCGDRLTKSVFEAHVKRCKLRVGKSAFDP